MDSFGRRHTFSLGPGEKSLDRDVLIEQLANDIEQRFGIKASSNIKSRLNLLLSAFRFSELMEWISHLRSLPVQHPLWTFLVEHQIVGETYFFRDPVQLNMLQSVIFPEIIAKEYRNGTCSINIWSAACSTGEEVYTLAILLLETMLEKRFAFGTPESYVSLLPGWKVKILGTDISTKALNSAKKAQYINEPMGAFRDPQLNRINWFEYMDNGKVVYHLETPQIPSASYRPKEYVRMLTEFQYHNLHQVMSKVAEYDLILCRNALIYFDEENKRKIQEKFIKALKPGGVLLLGVSDQLLTDKISIQKDTNGVFYYKKQFSSQK